MKGRDDDSAWAHQDDGEKLYTSVDAKRERRIVALGPPAQHTSWAAPLLALLIGGVAVFLYLHVHRQASPTGAASENAAQASASDAAQTQPPPAPTPGKTTGTPNKDEEAALTAQIDAANALAAVVPPPPAQPLPRSLPKPPPPPTDEKPPVAPEEPPRMEEPIIGAPMPLGKLAIQVEDYWVEPDPPGDTACAAFSGYIANNSAAAMALPQVEVTLLDGERREYKPYKAKLPTSATLNPLMRVKGLWAFQVPAKMPMWCANFKTKEGKDIKALCIGVNKRTSENAQLVGSADYRATSDELKAFASPRFLLQQQYEKELAKMDPIISDMDAVQKRLDRLVKPKKMADTAVAAAKAAADKRAADTKDAEADLKDLEANRPAFIHDEPRWERQVGEARVRLERLIRDKASTDKALKDKLAQCDKIASQEKAEQKQLDTLKTKFDAQRKVLEDLEKKMAE